MGGAALIYSYTIVHACYNLDVKQSHKKDHDHMHASGIKTIIEMNSEIIIR